MSILKVFLIVFGQVFFTTAQGISCWSVSGNEYPNQQQCPGSNACCGIAATCLSNRLCKNPNDNEGLFVRGPCLSQPFDEDCAKICVYNETQGIFPRVIVCADGSLCCNSDAQCCSKGNGRWLDAVGNLLSSRPSASTTSGTTSSTIANSSSPTSKADATSSRNTSTAVDRSSTASFETSSAASSTPAAAQEASESGSETLALKVGLGVAIPFAVCIAAFAIWFCIWRRRAAGKIKQDQSALAASQQYPEHYNPSGTYAAGQSPGNYGKTNYPELSDVHYSSQSSQSFNTAVSRPVELGVTPTAHNQAIHPHNYHAPMSSELQGSWNGMPMELEGSASYKEQRRLL